MVTRTNTDCLKCIVKNQFALLKSGFALCSQINYSFKFTVYSSITVVLKDIELTLSHEAAV